ncbi:TraA protein [Salmonella enterica]|nr:TraA protein [Salmonella enterica]
MAAYHHIPDEKLLKVFPELSLTESNIMALYSLGMSVAMIASSQNKSVKTVNNHLANVKFKLSTVSMFDLRTLFHIRIMLVLVKGRFSKNRKVFHELNEPQEELILQLASGISEREISFEKKMTETEVSTVITTALELIGAQDRTVLKPLVSMRVTEHLMKTFS